MIIYLLDEENEYGPFTWIQIYVMLQKGDLDSEVLARVDDNPDVFTLEELGYWAEGSDVGPFTWEEILYLRNEGCIDDETLTRMEEDPHFHTLSDTINRSPYLLRREPESAPAGTKLPYSSAAFALVGFLALAAAALLPMLRTNQPAPEPSAMPAATPDLTPPSPQRIEPPLKPAEPAKTSDRPVMRTESKVTALAMPISTISPPRSVPQSPPKNPAPLPLTRPAPTPLPGPQLASADSAAPSSTPLQNTTAPARTPKSADPPEPPAPVEDRTGPPPQALPAPVQVVSSRDFFSILSVKHLKKPPKDNVAVWLLSDPKNIWSKQIFAPCLEVRCATLENIRSNAVFAKAYFYNAAGTLVSQQYPAPSRTLGDEDAFLMPVLFHKEKPARIFFAIPPPLADQDWKAVIVFGDRQEAIAACYPPSESHFLLNYPEKKLVDERRTRNIIRKPAMDPMIQHVVKTWNAEMPQITLFLRPPKGITDPDQIRGVLAICVLSNHVEEMARDLQKEEMPGDYAGLFAFANREKLAVLAWGARRLWNPGANTDDLSPQEIRAADKSFDLVASAWEQGVKELCAKYGIPDRNFLLWGSCASAQWAHRLCLRKPEYFLAIAIHIPGSFDQPTPEARNVLWCLTTGELYGGYERSKRFVAECQKMGYPIMFKAIVGLGHGFHPVADSLNFEFLKWALQQKTQKEQIDAGTANRLAANAIGAAGVPWPEAFRNPPFYGDFVNQELFPSQNVEMIPAPFRTALPTKTLAAIWEKSR